MSSVKVLAGPHCIISADPLPLRKSIVKGTISNLTARITVAHIFSTPPLPSENGSSESQDADNWDGKAIFKLPAYTGVLSGLQFSVLNAQGEKSAHQVKAEIRQKQEVDALPECKELKQTIPFESIDLCYVSATNLPRGVDVEIRATFATELSADGSDLSLILPTVIVPTVYKHSLNAPSNTIVKAPGTQSFDLSLDLQLSLFGNISAVTSPSKHPILFTPSPIDPVKGRNLMTGSVSIKPGLTEAFPHCGDLVLHIQLAQPIDRLLPRCFLEYTPGKDHPIVAMLAFKPTANLPQRSCELSIVVDTAQQTAKLPFLQQMLKSCIVELREKYSNATRIYFNLVLMTGNGLLSAMAGRAQNLREPDAFDRVMKFIDFDLGKYYDGFFPTRKDFLKAVEDLFTLPKAVDTLPRQAILITTGQIAHPDMDTLLGLIRSRGNTDEQTAPCSGMFTLGIGSSHCNYNTLTNIGKVLGGAAEFVWDATDLESAKSKLMRQIRRALQPPLQNVRVEWEESLQNEYELVQTPDPMLPFYSEDLVPVYALLRTEPEPGIYEVELCADVSLPAGPSSAPPSPAPGSAPDSPGLNSSSSSISLTSSSAGIDGPVVMQMQSVSFKPEDVELEIEFLEDSDESSSSESSDDEATDAVAAAKRKAKPDPTRAKPGMLQDTTLHILGMTERIFDIEDSVTPEDEAASYKEIVDLATAYSFTSNYTAFYATSKLQNGVNVTIMTCEASEADEEDAGPNPDAPVKFKYGVDFMLQYRDMCLERPEGLPMIKGVTESRPRGSDGGNGSQSNGPMSGAGRNHRRAGQVGKDAPRASANSKMATPIKQGKVAPPGSNHRRNKSRGGPIPERKSLVVKGNWESKQVLAPMSPNGSAAPAVDPAVYAALFKRFQSDLNKLTRDNFDRLSAKLIALGREDIKDVEALRGVIGLIFETAVAQPKFATMYSDLCVILARNFPEFDADGTLHLPPPEGNSLASSGMIPPGTPGAAGAPPRITFKRLLLNRCQMEFENAPKPEQVAAMLAELPQEDRDEKELKIRTRALSNMTFVGELFNKSMLSSKIVLAVLQGLFGSMENPPTDPTPENLEMANKLLRSVGKLLDQQVPEFIQYVMRGCKSLQKNSALDSRIRFMLLGLVELQENEWVPREQQTDLKPKTIKEIHEDMRQKELEDLEKEEQQIRSSSSSIGRSPRGGKLGNSTEFSSPARGRGGFSAASPRSPSNLSSSAGGPVKRGGGTPNVVSPTPQQNTGSGSRWQARPPSRPTSPSSPLSSSTSSLQKGAVDDEASIGGNERRKLAFSTAVEKPQSWSAAAAGRRQQQNTPSSPAPSITVTNDVGATAPASKPFEPTGKVYSEDEVEEHVQLLVDEFITSNDSSEALNCLKELKASNQDVAITQKLILDAFEKKDPAREKMIELFSLFTTTQELSTETVTETFQNVLGDLEDFAIDIPFSPVYFGQFVGVSVAAGQLSMANLAGWLEPLRASGAAEKVATGVFKQIYSVQGEEKLKKLYADSGLDFKTAFLASKHATDPKYWDSFLQTRGASFASVFA